MGLRGMNRRFRHQTVGYQDILQYWNGLTGKDFTMLFPQYLKDIRIPTLEWQVKGKKLRYRWTNCIKDYNVPVQVLIAGQPTWLTPATGWKTMDIPAHGDVSGKGTPHAADSEMLRIAPDFYCQSVQAKGK
jgi:hypothetical protein